MNYSRQKRPESEAVVYGRFTVEYRLLVILLIAMGVILWQVRKSSDPSLPGRVADLEIENANSSAQEPSKGDDADETASKEAVQALRKLAEDLPNRQYIDDQMDILHRETKACGDEASALKAALSTITGSGIASMDVSQLKGIPSQVDGATKQMVSTADKITVMEAQTGADLGKRVDAATGKVDSMTNTVADLEDKVGGATKKLDDTANKGAALEKQFGEMMKKLDAVNKGVADLGNSVDATAKRIDSTSNSIAAIETQVSGAIKRIDTESINTASLETRFKAQSAQLQMAINKADENTAAIKKSLGEADVRKIVKSENTAIESDVNGLKHAIDGNVSQGDLESLRQQLTGMLQQASASDESRASALKAGIAKCDAGIDANIKNIQALSGNQQALGGAYNKLRDLIKTLISKIDPSTSPDALQSSR